MFSQTPVSLSQVCIYLKLKAFFIWYWILFLLLFPATGAVINLVCIIIVDQIYGYVALWLTELELNRTQTEYDDSLSLKIYILQFVNYYGSIFYVAFFKGQFIGYPGDYNRIFGFRQGYVY